MLPATQHRHKNLAGIGALDALIIGRAALPNDRGVDFMPANGTI